MVIPRTLRLIGAPMKRVRVSAALSVMLSFVLVVAGLVDAPTGQAAPGDPSVSQNIDSQTSTSTTSTWDFLPYTTPAGTWNFVGARNFNGTPATQNGASSTTGIIPSCTGGTNSTVNGISFRPMTDFRSNTWTDNLDNQIAGQSIGVNSFALMQNQDFSWSPTTNLNLMCRPLTNWLGTSAATRGTSANDGTSHPIAFLDTGGGIGNGEYKAGFNFTGLSSSYTYRFQFMMVSPTAFCLNTTAASVATNGNGTPVSTTNSNVQAISSPAGKQSQRVTVTVSGATSYSFENYKLSTNKIPCNHLNLSGFTVFAQQSGPTAQAALNWNLGSTHVPYGGSLDLATTGGSGTGNVAYSVSQASTCTVSGTVLLPGEAGSTCVITATKLADENFLSASTASQTITVDKVNQANNLTFMTPNAMAFGETLPVFAFGGSGEGAVSYSVTSAGGTGCQISAGMLSVTGSGTCSLSATRATSNNFNATATGQEALLSITVSKAAQELGFTSAVPTSPIAGGSYQVAASSTSGLTPSFGISSGNCTISGNTVQFTSSGNCVVRATQPGNGQYLAATAITQTIAVGQRNQTVSFDAATNQITSQVYGDGAFAVTATSTEATAALTYSRGGRTTNNACSVTAGGIVTVNAVGDCEVLVNSAGTANYSAASQISKLIQIQPDFATAPFLISSSGGNRSITVSFTPPVTNGGSAITAYQLVAVDQTAGSNITIAESGCASTLTNGFANCTVRGLSNGTTYKVRVAAQTAAGVGAYSELSPEVLPVTNPAAVQQLQVNESNSSLKIDWQDPDSLGGGTFSAYRIFIKKTSVANFDQSHYFTVSNFATHSVTVSQESPADGFGFAGGDALQNGIAYDVKVVTVTTANAAELSGNTAQSNKVPRTTPSAPALAPALSRAGNVVLSWAPPASDGGATITAYVPVFNGTACTLAHPTDMSCEIQAPTTPGDYSYQVVARNAAGDSTASTAVFSVTIPSPVTVTPAALSNTGFPVSDYIALGFLTLQAGIVLLLLRKKYLRIQK